MSESGYNQIQHAWEEEKNNERLQDLEDLKLSRMVAYLSEIRQSLAETPSENNLQVELFQEEGVNIEFMLKDLLMLRRQKILNAVLNGEELRGSMTLAEEDFYNRLRKGVENHLHFIDEVLTGKPKPTIKKAERSKATKSKEESPEDDSMEYVMVRFLEPIEETFVGLDDVEYGPFQKEDIATIPMANAKIWLRNGIVARVVVSTTGGDE